MRGLSWWVVIKNKMPLKSFFMPSANIREVSSMRPWLALMVAATAALVLDCKASAFKPIAALLMPVRSSLIWST